MTEALKRMVEAMAAEIVRQANECAWVEADVDSRNAYLVRIGYEESGGFSLDVERFARAGLEAIENPGREIAEVPCDIYAGISASSCEYVFQSMIEAILGRSNI